MAEADPPSTQMIGRAFVTRFGDAKEFYDWEYAKKVWSEMNTWEAEEKEWAKYSADFDPWFAEYKKSPEKASVALKLYDKNKVDNIKRAHDIQVAFISWRATFHQRWFTKYKNVILGDGGELPYLKTFDQDLADMNSRRPPCVPQKIIHECGPIPDWRSPEMKAEERKLTARREELMKGLDARWEAQMKGRK